MLGFNLARKLLAERRWEVAGLTRDPRARTVRCLRRMPGFSLQTGEVTERSSVDELLKRTEVVFHLAAVSSERLCRLRPEAAFAINAGATALVAERAGKKEVRMVYSSSCAVYADSFYPDEDSRRTRENLYGLTKLAGEQAIAATARENDLAYAVLRFTRLFGAGMSRNPVFDLLKGRTTGRATLYEGLESCYDFLYAGDAAELLVEAAVTEEWRGQTVNAGTGKGVMLKELARIVEEHLGRPLEVTVARQHTCFDVPKVDRMRALGFAPRYSLAEGLVDMKKVEAECGLAASRSFPP